jgi:hypothetical protein
MARQLPTRPPRRLAVEVAPQRQTPTAKTNAANPAKTSAAEHL